jgi:hypothetical protein
MQHANLNNLSSYSYLNIPNIIKTFIDIMNDIICDIIIWSYDIMIL